MKIDAHAALSLALEPGISGADIRVWLCLVDCARSPSELAASTGMDKANIAASCRRLRCAGWLDLVEIVGRSKRYRARAIRNPSADLPGQMGLDKRI